MKYKILEVFFLCKWTWALKMQCVCVCMCVCRCVCLCLSKTAIIHMDCRPFGCYIIQFMAISGTLSPQESFLLIGCCFWSSGFGVCVGWHWLSLRLKRWILFSPPPSERAARYYPDQIISTSEPPTLRKMLNEQNKKKEYYILNDNWSNCRRICWLFWIYMFAHLHCRIISNESQKQSSISS